MTGENLACCTRAWRLILCTVLSLAACVGAAIAAQHFYATYATYATYASWNAYFTLLFRTRLSDNSATLTQAYYDDLEHLRMSAC